MIRPYRSRDLAPLMQLWLKSTILAHPFIREDYWRESASAIRDIYIPQSQTWVDEDQGSLIGFISVLEGRFIGAISAVVMSSSSLHRANPPLIALSLRQMRGGIACSLSSATRLFDGLFLR